MHGHLRGEKREPHERMARGVNNRRDEQQTKASAIRSPNSSKKNTKKRCRDKMGIEHRPFYVAYDDLKNASVVAPE